MLFRTFAITETARTPRNIPTKRWQATCLTLYLNISLTTPC